MFCKNSLAVPNKNCNLKTVKLSYMSKIAIKTA